MLMMMLLARRPLLGLALAVGLTVAVPARAGAPTTGVARVAFDNCLLRDAVPGAASDTAYIAA